MCGIFGVVDRNPVNKLLDVAEVIQQHRGPDGNGKHTWHIGDWQIGFAHQRLAIIDLTAAGAQPMSHDGGTTWITFNGEIYNYLELRLELEGKGRRFMTQTDTEVILAAIDEWGIAAALGRFNGMWAFAWLDVRRGELCLARDRLGVKPCYLLSSGQRLLFGSEIKTLLATSGERRAVNKAAVAAYLDQLQVDFDNDTFFEGIVKLPPGHFARIDLKRSNLELKMNCYWSLDHSVSRAPMRLEEAVEQVRFLLDDAVKLRLRSDVPVGILLSGGLDSSAIAGAAHRLDESGKVVFLGAVSDDPTVDESRHMKVVARFLNRPLHEVQLKFTSQALLDLIRRVTWHNDEPIGGFSCIAQYLLMQRAKERGVTVLLSGQGADEAYCGYLKYVAFYVQSMIRLGRIDQAIAIIGSYLIQKTVFGEFRMATARRYLPARLRRDDLSLRGPALSGQRNLTLTLASGNSVNERQALDFERYSVPALTHWEDRNSMAWSREVRSPFLDYRLVQHGVAMPMEYKLRRGWTKYVLRRATQGRIPAQISWRRDKKGFTTPEAKWMRRELRSALDTIARGNARCVRSGLVSPTALTRRYQNFLTGKGPAVMSRELFQCLSLESWLESYGPYLESA